ncbi:MAG: DUF4956 domain-containing protein [Blastocatellia bacterium]
MPDWLLQTLNSPHDVTIRELCLRLAISFALGWIVAAIYRGTHPSGAVTQTFPATLTLMTIIIAMSTQVIGDNVARAFSLVGALSIVRFRTVVQDTRDTAFVIFAVVVGMAVGSGYLSVALIGMVVTGIAAWVMQPRRGSLLEGNGDMPAMLLTVRMELNRDPKETLGALFEKWLSHHDLRRITVSKQGNALDTAWHIRLRPGGALAEFANIVGAVDGVQQVEFRRE